MTRPRLHACCRAGFTLVEVLVSLVIVAVGIVALGELLRVADRRGKMSELRATAALLAQDIADRLRANPAGAALGPAGYDLAATAYPGVPVSPRAACSDARPCTPEALAQADLAGWTARLRLTLPDGSGSLRYRAGAGARPDSADVWVAWTDPVTLAAGRVPERAADECPPAWRDASPSVRCVHLLVGF